MQKAVAVALAILASFYSFCFYWSPLNASASLSPSGTWVLLCCDGDTGCRNAHNAWSIPKPRAIYLLGGAGRRRIGGGFGGEMGGECWNMQKLHRVCKQVSCRALRIIDGPALCPRNPKHLRRPKEEGAVGAGKASLLAHGP